MTELLSLVGLLIGCGVFLIPGVLLAKALSERSERNSTTLQTPEPLTTPKPSKASTKNALPYQARHSLLTQGERAFYDTLKNAAPMTMSICMKVRLADLVHITTPRNSSEYMSYFGKISQKHIDFILCDNQTLKPLLAIELDDKSHRQRNRQERDSFVNQALDAAQLPLLRVRASRSYDENELSTDIRKALLEGELRQ